MVIDKADELGHRLHLGLLIWPLCQLERWMYANEPGYMDWWDEQYRAH